MTRTVIILADAWAGTRIGGLSQLERTLLLVDEAWGSTGSSAPQVVIVWEATKSTTVRPTIGRRLGLDVLEIELGRSDLAEVERIQGGECLVLGTDVVLGRGTLANLPFAARCAINGTSAGEVWTSLRAIRQAFETDAVGTLGVDGGRWHMERRLFQTLRKPTDGFVSVYLNRPISRLVSQLLVYTPVTPNGISVAVFGLAALSAWFLVGGTYAGFVTGLLLYQASSILDGCDGEIARVTFTESPFGRWIDTIIDKISMHMLTVGLGLGLARASGANWYVSPFFWEAALSSIAMMAMLWWIAHYTAKRTGKSGHFGDFGKMFLSDARPAGGRERKLDLIIAKAVKRDAFALYVLVPALLGVAEWSLHLIALGVAGHVIGILAPALRGLAARSDAVGGPMTRTFSWVRQQSLDRPGLWFAGILLVTVPAVISTSRLSLDTDLTRLLPRSSPTAVATRELGSVVGGGNYVTVLFEGDDTTSLGNAVDRTAATLRDLPGIASVQYEYPVDFFSMHRFSLIPSYYLEAIQRSVDEARTGDRTGPDEPPTYGERQLRSDIERFVTEFGSLPRYHQSADGRTRGMFVRVRQDLTSMSASRTLLADIEHITNEAAADFGLVSGVRGSLRNKTDEIDVIRRDLSKAGVMTGIIILATLLLSFRSPRPLPVVLIPLIIGLTWGFAFVPLTVGSLNLITSFLVVVMFGLGIDYAIHLVKRFQLERHSADLETALETTMRSTGGAVIVSAVTTALALIGLAVSGFRGFSEFGIVGALSISAVTAAMVLVMPVTLVLGDRLGLLPPITTLRTRTSIVPGRVLTVGVVAAVLVAGVLASTGLTFNYDFTRMRIEIPQTNRVQGRVYTTTNSPGAIFLAEDLSALDRSLEILDRARRQPGSTIGRLSSIRDFAPAPSEARERQRLLNELRGTFSGLGALILPDERWRAVAADLQTWEPPEAPPAPEEIPELLQAGLLAQDGSGRYLISIFPSVERREGLNAMAFTEELYDLELPAHLLGPVGETPVMAEILWLVTGEGPWLVLLIALGVFVIVYANRHSLTDTLWILLPLVSGVVVTLGVLVLVGIELNFFNVVVIPALLGMGVDHGVHYYRRWRELDQNTDATQHELLGPLTVCTATTMTGYAGMLFSSHTGLQSIATVACIGLAATWLTSLVLLPGLLKLRAAR